jgi:predicted DNA-binding transcriptional regulator AlpA
MFPKLHAELSRSTADLDALMSVRQTCAFLGGVSKMSLYRWWNDPASGFPRPFKVGQKNFWIRRDLIAFRDRARAQVTHPGIPLAQAADDSVIS